MKPAVTPRLKQKALIMECLHEFFNSGSATITQPVYLVGIQSLADFLKCSYQTAHAYKKSGKIPFSQQGKKIIFEVSEVLKSMRKEVNNGQ